jgi:hypothetical protein
MKEKVSPPTGGLRDGVHGGGVVVGAESERVDQTGTGAGVRERRRNEAAEEHLRAQRSE